MLFPISLTAWLTRPIPRLPMIFSKLLSSMRGIGSD